ncbi:unnamed protein product [Gordionus sp. m RMFG-2023]|uniref:venom protein 302-like n=1 Tax=Gordionus sp. m RMFG-2023 TaxID=3053472 RepID=UPI0030E107B5
MQFAAKLCLGIVLVLFNSNKFVNADDSCACATRTPPCSTAPPSDCKGDLTLDQCGCCYVCAKVKGEVCWGPYLAMNKCSSGLICILDNYKDEFLAKGICTTEYARVEGEACGVSHMQGNCKKGLKCEHPHPSMMGKCVKDS